MREDTGDVGGADGETVRLGMMSGVVNVLTGDTDGADGAGTVVVLSGTAANLYTSSAPNEISRTVRSIGPIHIGLLSAMYALVDDTTIMTSSTRDDQVIAFAKTERIRVKDRPTPMTFTTMFTTSRPIVVVSAGDGTLIEKSILKISTDITSLTINNIDMETAIFTYTNN